CRAATSLVTLSLHDALPIYLPQFAQVRRRQLQVVAGGAKVAGVQAEAPLIGQPGAGVAVLAERRGRDAGVGGPAGMHALVPGPVIEAFEAARRDGTLYVMRVQHQSG